jgi:hypothetical protein
MALAATGEKRPFVLRKGINTTADLDTVPLQLTAATVTIDRETHSGRLLLLNRAAGIAVTLPAALGTGDLYRFHVKATFTGASTIKVANGTDVMQGTALLFSDGGDACLGYATGATADTIDLLGTANSTGGIFGGLYELEDALAGFWRVRIVSDAGGTEATPIQRNSFLVL